MAKKVETAILKWLDDKGPVTVRPTEIAKRAKIEGTNLTIVNAALDTLKRKGSITTSLDPTTRLMTLRPVRVRA